MQRWWIWIERDGQSKKRLLLWKTSLPFSKERIMNQLSAQLNSLWMECFLLHEWIQFHNLQKVTQNGLRYEHDLTDQLLHMFSLLSATVILVLFCHPDTSEPQPSCRRNPVIYNVTRELSICSFHMEGPSLTWGLGSSGQWRSFHLQPSPSQKTLTALRCISEHWEHLQNSFSFSFVCLQAIPI